MAIHVRDGDWDEEGEADEAADDVVILGPGEEDIDDEDAYFLDDLGPDERDADLMDGTWEEQRHRSGPGRDWGAVQAGVGLLLLLAIVVPMLLVFAR